MKKEEIISVLNQLDDWSFGYCSTPEEAAEEIISSLQDKTPKVGNNEKAKEVCGYCNGEGWIEEPMRTIPCPRCGGNKQTG